jgi:hypothetical protein
MELAAVATVLAAMGGVLKLVLDHLRKMSDKHDATLEAMQKRQETFLGNHMSSNTATIRNLVEVSGELVSKVDVLHQDNLETARVLKDYKKEA